MQKLFAYLFICLFVYLLTPLSFAIPGQLIYDTNAPDVTNKQVLNCDEAIVPYKTESEKNSSLYETCQLQQSQLQKTNILLTNNLSQERKTVIILKIALGIVVVSSALGILYVKRRR